jgi:hypothetical protein
MKKKLFLIRMAHRDLSGLTLFIYGLIERQSEYYIAREGNELAIFHRDGRHITEWFNWVYEYGLVEGKSDHYIAYTREPAISSMKTNRFQRDFL